MTSNDNELTVLNDGDVCWEPTNKDINDSILTSFVHFINETYGAKIPIGDQQFLHQWSLTENQKFWHALSKFLHFPLNPTPKLADVKTFANVPHLPSLVNVHWFHRSTTNFATPFLRQAQLHPNKPAVVSLSESNSHRRVITFSQLRTRVHHVIVALRTAYSVKKGDSVAIVAVNSDHAVVLLLATAAIGATFACCSPDFGVDAIMSRFKLTKPKVIFYSREYIYKDIIHDISEKIKTVCCRLPSVRLIVNSNNHSFSKPSNKSAINGRHICLSLNELEKIGENIMKKKGLHDVAHVQEMSMRDPVVTMFSSGTTGAPKCIVQGTGILLNQMKEQALHCDIDSSSTIFCCTTTGWMMFNWVVAGLALGARIILYDGTPQPSENPLRLIQHTVDEKATHFVCGAALLASFADVSSKMPTLKGKQAHSLRMVLATGSPSTQLHYNFVRRFFPAHVQYASMSGGTEINGCFALGTRWQPVHTSHLQCIGLGMDVVVLNTKGEPVINQTGELCCRNACPCMPLYFGHDENSNHSRYRDAYFKTYGDSIWCHGDFASMTSGGSLIISGRSDSTLNPGGVRIGTADIYQVVESLNFISDSIVVDVPISSRSIQTVVILFVVLDNDNDNVKLNREHIATVKTELRRRISPRHVPYAVLQVHQIPYTLTGKKCEIPVKKMLIGKELTNRHAVKNPDAFDDIFRAFQTFLSLKQRSKL